MSMSYRPALRVEVALKTSPVPLYLHIAERLTSAAIALRHQGVRTALSALFEPRELVAVFDDNDGAVDVAVGSHTVNVRFSDGNGQTEFVYPLAHITDVLIEE